MNELLSLMKPGEIEDGLWLVSVFERWGSMSPEEADEWRRRILARQRFLEPAPPARGVGRENTPRSLRRSLGQATTIRAAVEVAKSTWPVSSSRGQVPACGPLR